MTIVRSGCAALLFIALLVGCKSTHFELELRPEGDELYRKVTMWSEDGDAQEKHLAEFALEDLQRIADIYGTDVPDELVARHVFERNFTGKTPNDLGGAGWYLHGETSMGALFAYSERFGEDEIADDLRAREWAANSAMDVLIAWMDSEIGDKPNYPEFRHFVDNVVREDLWNLVLYSWGYDLFAGTSQAPGQVLDEDTLLLDMSVRSVAYLADHGYFDPLQIPEFVLAEMHAEERDDLTPLFTMIARGIATKMGVSGDEALPAPLAALAADANRLSESFQEFETTNDDLRQAVDEWIQSGQLDDDFEYGDDEVMLELLTGAFVPQFDIFGRGGDQLTATLRIDAEPLATNGLWDPEVGVTWAGTIRGRGKTGENLPNIFYATWSESNEAFQNEHFGQLLVDGEALAEYWYWHAGLEKNKSKQWDAFISTLKPGPDLADELQHFCFAGDEAECEEVRGSGDSAYPMVNSIISELNQDEE